jgi:hypothetical protein
MGQTLHDQVQMLLGRPIAGISEVEAAALAALPAAHIDVHGDGGAA